MQDRDKSGSKQSARTKRGPYHHGDLREALLTAAEVELTDRGIEGLSLRGVAKRAGVSHAAPAHHFGDKAGLLTALTTIGFQRLREAQMSRSELTKDVGQQLIAKGRGYLAFATDNPALFDLMFGSNQPDYTNPDLGDAADAALAPLVDSIVATTGGSPFGGGVPTRELVAGWALVHGLAGLLNHRKLRWAQDEEGGYEALIESVLSTRLTIR